MNEDKLDFFAKFSEFGKNIIPSLKDLISNEQFQTYLDRAGGIISLIGVGLKIYETIKKNLETDEDRASNSLIRIVFATATEALKHASKEYFHGEEIKIDMDLNMKKTMLQNVFESFTAYYEDDGSFTSLTDLPSILSFKSSLVSQLKQKLKGQITDFEEQFDALFESSMENDPDIQKIEILRERKKRQRNLKKYLQYVITESEKNSLNNLGRKSSDKASSYDGNYYIEKRQAIMVDARQSWSSTDDEVQEEYCNKIINDNNDVEKKIDDFVKSGSIDSRYLFIGAPFGTGKTTLVKKVASKYADEYLKAKTKSRYIPILVLLKYGLERAYNDLNLYDVFDRIIAPDNNNNEKAFNRNVLLLLDGLDEYHDNDVDQEKNLADNSKDIKMLMEKIENDFRKYPNLKVIITVRLQHDLPSKLPLLKGKNYLRLLPFTEQQVEEFFEHYDVNLKFNQISMVSKGLSKEITNPLLAWMFSKIYPKIREDLEHIKSTKEQELTNNMAKSLIYLVFFHRIIEGKSYEDLSSIKEREDIIKSYRDEKRKLRLLAILMQICGGKITDENVKQVQKMFRYTLIDISIQDLGSTSYFYVKDKRNSSIKFVHETFKEYL
jgi:hypothetical protein